MILEKLMDMASSKNAEDILLAMTIFEQQSQSMEDSERHVQRSILYTECIDSADDIGQKELIVKRVNEIYEGYPFAEKKYGNYQYSYTIDDIMTYVLYKDLPTGEFWEPLIKSQKIRDCINNTYGIYVDPNNVQESVHRIMIEISERYLEERIDALEFDNDVLETENKTSEEINDELENQNLELQKEIDDLKSELDFKEETIVSLEQEIQDLNDEIKDLTKDYSSSSIKP